MKPADRPPVRLSAAPPSSTSLSTRPRRLAPGREWCQRCTGSGWLRTGTCPMCKGSGDVYTGHAPTTSAPGFPSGLMSCDTCNGTKVVGNALCQTCLGRGLVRYAPPTSTTFLVPDACWRLCLEDAEGRVTLVDIDRSQMVTELTLPGHVVVVLALLGNPTKGGKSVRYERDANDADWPRRSIGTWVQQDDPADTHPIPESWPS